MGQAVVEWRSAVVGFFGGGAARAECSAALGSEVDGEGECEATREVELIFGFHFHRCAHRRSKQWGSRCP